MKQPNPTWMAWIFTLLAVMTAQIAGTSLYFAFWFVRPVYITVQPPAPPSAIWLPESEAEISRLAKELVEADVAHTFIWAQTRRSDKDSIASYKSTYRTWLCGPNTFPEGKR